MAKHIQTQTEWESTMARRIMDQLRGELYLDQRYPVSYTHLTLPTILLV